MRKPGFISHCSGGLDRRQSRNFNIAGGHRPPLQWELLEARQKRFDFLKFGNGVGVRIVCGWEGVDSFFGQSDAFGR